MGNGTGIASVHFGPNWTKIHTTWTKMRRSNVEQQHVANVYKLGVVDQSAAGSAGGDVCRAVYYSLISLPWRSRHLLV